MNREKDAIATGGCPRCGAPKGEPCQYTQESTTGSLYGRITHRVGDPTQRPHNERLQRLARREKRQHYRMNPIPPTPPAIVALREFERQETDALTSWLRVNAYLLTNPINPKKVT